MDIEEAINSFKETPKIKIPCLDVSCKKSFRLEKKTDLSEIPKEKQIIFKKVEKKKL